MFMQEASSSLLLGSTAAGGLALLAATLFPVPGPAEAQEPATGPHLNPGDEVLVQQHILALLRIGNRIGAIYLQQQLTGDGFHQARSTIEALAARLGANAGCPAHPWRRIGANP